MLDFECQKADKEELQNHAEELHKQREIDKKLLEEAKARIQSVEQELGHQIQVNESLREDADAMKEERESLEVNCVSCFLKFQPLWN